VSGPYSAPTVSLKLLCSSAADDELIDAWLSVKGLYIAREAPRSKGADWASKRAGTAGLIQPVWAHFVPVRGLLCPTLVLESSRSFPLLHVGPCRQFLSELDEAPCLARFDTFLARSSEFVIFLGCVPGLLESCSLHCLTCTGLQGLVMRCLMNLSRKSRFQH
jgi:hypothetical protein